MNRDEFIADAKDFWAHLSPFWHGLIVGVVAGTILSQLVF